MDTNTAVLTVYTDDKAPKGKPVLLIESIPGVRARYFYFAEYAEAFAKAAELYPTETLVEVVDKPGLWRNSK